MSSKASDYGSLKATQSHFGSGEASKLGASGGFRHHLLRGTPTPQSPRYLGKDWVAIKELN